MFNRPTRVLQKVFLAISSLSLGLLILELISRSIIEPVNFLRPELIDDTILGHAIRPASGGHDAWGFRNQIVPASATIVTIGDSQTYGVSAAGRDSWPAILSELSKQRVYNLSLGGYSPVQYFHLLTSKAIKLSPKFVVVGFYLGNDLLETYELVENNPHWIQLKRSGVPAPIYNKVASPVGSAPRIEAPASFFSDIRTWLAQRSVIYNILIYSIVGEFARVAEAVFVSRQAGGEAHVRYDRNGIHTGFTPEHRLRALDLEDSRVQDGLLISLDVFAKMEAYCLEHAIHLLVAMIPTKESVYARYLENDPALENTAIKSLLTNERTVTAIVKAFFEDHGIPYVDLLPRLQEEVTRFQLYPGNFDGHPNKNGYRVIAENVERYLRNLPLKAAGAGQVVLTDAVSGSPALTQ
jgi:lysophospholipase L1-like esterase